MKKWLVALCMFLMVPIIKGQGTDFTVKSGEAIKFKMSDFTTGIRKLGVIDGNAFFLFLPYTSGGGLEISISGKNPFIGKFDLDNKLIKKTEIELKQDKQEPEFKGVLMVNNRRYQFERIYINDK